MSDSKKFLDYEGVKHLWSKISMEDYPNNETLMAVINAIDETKADKSEIPTKLSELIDDKGYLTEHQSLADYAKTTDLGDLAKKDIVAKTDLASDV